MSTNIIQAGNNPLYDTAAILKHKEEEKKVLYNNLCVLIQFPFLILSRPIPIPQSNFSYFIFLAQFQFLSPSTLLILTSLIPIPHSLFSMCYIYRDVVYIILRL